jgi:hypothetical protein
MDAILGLVGLVIFSVCIIVLAAGMTWLVVKMSPARGAKHSSDSTS